MLSVFYEEFFFKRKGHFETDVFAKVYLSDRTKGPRIDLYPPVSLETGSASCCKFFCLQKYSDKLNNLFNHLY